MARDFRTLLLLSLALYSLISTTKASESQNSAPGTQPFTTFVLQGSNGRYARLDARNLHSNPLIFDSHEPRAATEFLLDSQGGLIVSSTSINELGGRQAMQATNAGTKAVVFETPRSSGAGFTPLACAIHQDLAFTCTVQGCRASGGSLGKAREWYLGEESGPRFMVKTVPVVSRQRQAHVMHKYNSTSSSSESSDQVVLRIELSF
ncbi:hypothetical protein AC578_9142 [Pseudocercospora eumusae]|uniref:Ig-like domain-containing protein n=1 Tax=Pseudocercospora eumusae TaxID=321146 RepID=A0A139HVA0_9PEZI|nr:hypothetical protein AC578_9142 [Pseudocercospora eumusae]